MLLTHRSAKDLKDRGALAKTGKPFDINITPKDWTKVRFVGGIFIGLKPVAIEVGFDGD